MKNLIFSQCKGSFLRKSVLNNTFLIQKSRDRHLSYRKELFHIFSLKKSDRKMSPKKFFFSKSVINEACVTVKLRQKLFPKKCRQRHFFVKDFFLNFLIKECRQRHVSYRKLSSKTFLL